jgi:CheY-like chemotaxis protein
VAEGQKKTILLVEDEALIAMDEAATLRGHGCEVLTAAYGFNKYGLPFMGE